MWNRIYSIVTNPRWIALIGTLVILYLLYDVVAFKYYIAVLCVAATIAAVLLLRWWMQRKNAVNQGDVLAQIINPDNKKDKAESEEVKQLRIRMAEAIKTIRKSKLGDTTGRAALYELPWYMVIGNPAAGKSSAIANSGLTFPFANTKGGPAIQGVGGTRNCDWFFSTEGLLLDTAGRYSAYDADKSEWLSFLDLLKKSRSKAPINGIIIAVNIMELIDVDPDEVKLLARNLRSRVQDLTEKLEIYAPVYLVFTKLDLMAGFRDFFAEMEAEDRKQVWGATLPYEVQLTNKSSALGLFEQEFDALYDGLKDLSVAQLALRHHQTTSPSLMTFPMELLALKSTLRLLVATLFEDNPFQFKPIMRGFYFTSALQEGTVASSLMQEMATKYQLLSPTDITDKNTMPQGESNAFFLKDLFSKVILKDKYLVKQHTNRQKRKIKYAVFIGSVALLGGLLGGLAWSYKNNLQLISRVKADFVLVKKAELSGSGDLETQLKSLEILQDRISQLESYQKNRPLALSFGLYQGGQLSKKLRQEYFNGIKHVMLVPVHTSIERYLGEVNANARNIQPLTNSVATATKISVSQQYTEASPTNAEDAYNALKAYLMMGDKSRIEPRELNDQLTRFWRTWLEANRGNMSRSDMIRLAEKIIGFSLANATKADFPVTAPNYGLVDQTRDSLRSVIRGLPARERVMSEIKLRAAARYPSISIASVLGEQGRGVVAGSYVVSGAYTLEAWKNYISDEIDKASTNTVQGEDWVLKTIQNDDLTLSGSPEQIRKELVNQYKKDYTLEWNKFLMGIHYESVNDLNGQIVLLNKISIKDSPLTKLFGLIDRQTSWDNPTVVNEGMKVATGKFLEWLKNLVRSKTPSQVSVDMPRGSEATQSLTSKYGALGQSFFLIHNLMVPRPDNQNRSQWDDYMANIGAVRTRMNQIKTAGDIGPGALEFVSSTHDTANSTPSELNATTKLVDEQILIDGSPELKQTIRTLLITPVLQTFTLLQGAVQTEVNKTWQAQVYKPFQDSLAQKYPFNTRSSIEATPQEISRFFGEKGQIAAFFDKTLAPLVSRHGDQLSPKTWANIGVQVEPQFIADFPRYLQAVSGGTSAATSGSGVAAAPSATTFQIMPLPISGLTEYSITLDGQMLRYRNGTQVWTTFVWPNPTTQPGANIRAVTFEGKTVDVFDAPGSYGIEKFISTAARKSVEPGVFEMSWTGQATTVSVRFRIISGANTAAPDTPTPNAGAGNLKGLTLPMAVIGKGVAVSVEPPATAPAPLPAALNTPPVAPPSPTVARPSVSIRIRGVSVGNVGGSAPSSTIPATPVANGY